MSERAKRMFRHRSLKFPDERVNERAAAIVRGIRFDLEGRGLGRGPLAPIRLIEEGLFNCGTEMTEDDCVREIGYALRIMTAHPHPATRSGGE